MADIEVHAAAVKALVTTSGKTVYVGRAPSSALAALGAGGPGYIVLELGQGLASTTTLEGSSDSRFCRFVTRYFSSGWEGVDNLRTHVKQVVLDVRPTVTGRKTNRIDHETEFPLDRTESMPEAVIFSGDSFTFTTVPA